MLVLETFFKAHNYSSTMIKLTGPYFPLPIAILGSVYLNSFCLTLACLLTVRVERSEVDSLTVSILRSVPFKFSSRILAFKQTLVFLLADSFPSTAGGALE